MQIGRVAKETRMTVDAIRFYERHGLLPRAPRSEVRFLRQMQELGFSLAEIRELLSLRRDDAHACGHVCDLLDVKLAAVRAKQSELRKLERELRQALGRCRRALRKKSPGAHRCPVLAEASRAKGRPT